jgi:hypothetical protein
MLLKRKEEREKNSPWSKGRRPSLRPFFTQFVAPKNCCVVCSSSVKKLMEYKRKKKRRKKEHTWGLRRRHVSSPQPLSPLFVVLVWYLLVCGEHGGHSLTFITVVVVVAEVAVVPKVVVTCQVEQ